jgi:hypothetical protein
MMLGKMVLTIVPSMITSEIAAEINTRAIQRLRSLVISILSIGVA